MLQHRHSGISGLLLVLALGACTESPYRASNLQQAKGDGRSVVVTHARNEAGARPLAENYCRAQGAAAHFTGMVQYRTRREILRAASFECQPNPPPHSAVQDIS